MSDELYGRLEKYMEGTSLGLAALSEVLTKMDARLTKAEVEQNAVDLAKAEEEERTSLIKDVASAVAELLKATDDLDGDKTRTAKKSGALNADGDDSSGSWYATYTMGSVSVGYSQAYYDSGASGSATAATTAKAIGTSAGTFENSQMSIAFNVNDNLSISYTESTDTYDDSSNVSSGTEIADVDQETEALQAAYSMGGMTIKAFQMEASNPGWDSDATKNTFSEVSIGLSF